MRQSLFLAVMLCLTPMLAGCLDSLTGDEELRAGCTYTEAENWDPLAKIDMAPVIWVLKDARMRALKTTIPYLW